MITRLQAAMATATEAGKTIRIVYDGGSQPGAARDVLPLTIDDGMLRALDVATGIEKHFRLEKIRIPDATDLAPPYDPALADADQTIRSFFTPRVAELAAMGWHVELSDKALSLHRYFKNGRPRKGPDVWLMMEPPPQDSGEPDEPELNIIISVGLSGVSVREETLELQRSKRWRPYYASSVGLPTSRRFASLAHAASLVFMRARELAPRKDSSTSSAPRILAPGE